MFGGTASCEGCGGAQAAASDIMRAALPREERLLLGLRQRSQRAVQKKGETRWGERGDGDVAGGQEQLTERRKMKRRGALTRGRNAHRRTHHFWAQFEGTCLVPPPEHRQRRKEGKSDDDRGTLQAEEESARHTSDIQLEHKQSRGRWIHLQSKMGGAVWVGWGI